jgi:hypothetical protein
LKEVLGWVHDFAKEGFVAGTDHYLQHPSSCWACWSRGSEFLKKLFFFLICSDSSCSTIVWNHSVNGCVRCLINRNWQNYVFSESWFRFMKDYLLWFTVFVVVLYEIKVKSFLGKFWDRLVKCKWRNFNLFSVQSWVERLVFQVQGSSPELRRCQRKRGRAIRRMVPVSLRIQEEINYFLLSSFY